MRGVAAGAFLLWGVATIMLAALNTATGKIPPEKFVLALFAGAVLLTVAWLINRLPRRKRPRDAGAASARDA